MTSSPKTSSFGNSPATCGYSRVLELISDKWTALVMYTLEDGSVRYGEMGRRIDGISKKMLTQTVRKLERDGLVRRHVTPTVPPTVDYSLTPLGETLLQPMKELRQWARVNYPHVEAARADYDLAHGGDSQPPAE
ncbi:winged helix-turn-helix transcriptional regulator [Paenibacillus elgii]|uniref:winged helix-turn-helix transcriptional regulator n=1 Tax=Paenibacillus elgii TaxID=189691 RepID=UPI0035276577